MRKRAPRETPFVMRTRTRSPREHNKQNQAPICVEISPLRLGMRKMHTRASNKIFLQVSAKKHIKKGNYAGQSLGSLGSI